MMKRPDGTGLRSANTWQRGLGGTAAVNRGRAGTTDRQRPAQQQSFERRWRWEECARLLSESGNKVNWTCSFPVNKDCNPIWRLHDVLPGFMPGQGLQRGGCRGGRGPGFCWERSGGSTDGQWIKISIGN